MEKNKIVASIKKMPLHLLVVFFMSVCCSNVFAARVDVQTVLNKKISVDFANVLLKEAIVDLGRRMPDISFTYVESGALNETRISMCVKDEKVIDVLNKMLLPNCFKYTIVDDHVVIWFDAARNSNDKQTTTSKRRLNIARIPIIKGMVGNAQMATIKAVSIMVMGGGRAGATDGKGAFILHDVADTAMLVFTIKGYKPQQVLAKNAADGFLIVQLAKKAATASTKIGRYIK